MMPTGFDVKVAPAVTAGAYSAGDIVGGLLTFQVADGSPATVEIEGCQVALKAAVTSTLSLHLFTDDPTSTVKTDNAAYSLNVADAFKVAATLLPATLTDHGTPNIYNLDGLFIPVRPGDGKNIYGLLVDGTGFTLTSVADVQVRLRGRII